MPFDSVDVTVVLNGHREGILIHRTLRSILRAVNFASEEGVRCEIVAVLDRPDQATAEYFARVGSPILRVVEVDCRDPGLARNRGVAEASGVYIAFVDGDDLVSRNWLAEAFVFAEHQRPFGRRLALHPEANIFFGEDWSVLLHVDQESPEWSLGSLFAANYWTALVFARKEDLVAVPYRASDPDSGFGYEDWDWNCLAVGAGMIHKVIPDTWHFIRLKDRGSRNRVAQKCDLLIPPSPLFEKLETEPEGARLDNSEAADSSESPRNAGLEQILSCPHLLAEWRELARVEPDLFPTKDKLSRYRFWKPFRKGVGDSFGQILRRWGQAPSHVILCDRYAVGDDGLTALNYVRALVDVGADVLVIAEEAGHAGLGYGHNGSVRVLDCGEIGSDLEPYWRTRLLSQALIQRPPRTIHLIESSLGYEAISSYGSAISGRSRVFASVPDLRWSHEGERTGLAVAHFDRIVPYLSGLLSESQAVLDWFCDTFGYAPDQCHQVRGGVDPSKAFMSFRPRSRSGRPGVHWVGDDGQQSCPSMLLQVARLMPDCDFAVSFGKRPTIPWSDDLNTALLSEPNIAFAPACHVSHDLMAEASALLHTSLVDGIPGVFIEASVCGVPIVAPSMAAIREMVDDETGYPVRDFSSPDAYVNRIRQVLDEPEKTRRRVEKAQRRIKKEYSWGRFVEVLQSINGYL